MPIRLNSTRLKKWGIRLFSGATIVLTGAAAEAQVDRDWLEHALQSAEQATSPWPVVAHPDASDKHSTQMPAELPSEAAPSLSHRQLDVEAVDTFDDPWGPGPQLSVSTQELIDPWAEDLPSRGSPEKLGRGASYEHIDLVDPWE